MEMQFLRCAVCGQMVAVVKKTACPVVCCGKPMEEVKAGVTDGAYEKHVPVYEVKDRVVYVTVGSVEHPMLPEHHIEWVSLRTKFGNQRKALSAGDAPKVEFALLPGDEVLEVYEYCNLHGLWKA